MDPRIFATVFVTVFVAELGDKTQLATLLFSADRPASRWTVFAASASALVLAAGIGVLAGGWLAQHVSPRHLKLLAGAGFMVIGAWTLRSAFTA
ncbi:TMEM165/GDT1 family protein [Sinimarinibacterium flocculans]|uniref:TMEM165/GDT1 family protein n=1 Tax=Sinimarinibacterium flocculans TaxID=985250 RepID=UPI002492F7DD|nr:TMEM165/GDT1 family protein [Sinimarinibacterium flocculans]MEC9361780.1 TMEM165/GDT1 family protein [Pseudomonadota bacterium]